MQHASFHTCAATVAIVTLDFNLSYVPSKFPKLGESEFSHKPGNINFIVHGYLNKL